MAVSAEKTPDRDRQRSHDEQHHRGAEGTDRRRVAALQQQDREKCPGDHSDDRIQVVS